MYFMQAEFHEKMLSCLKISAGIEIEKQIRFSADSTCYFVEINVPQFTMLR